MEGKDCHCLFKYRGGWGL